MNVAKAVRRRKDLLAIMAVVLLTSVFPVDLLTSAQPERRGSDGQFSGKQGEVLIVTVPAGEEATAVAGRFLKRGVTFFRIQSSKQRAEYVGLLGIDLQDSPGSHELSVEVTSPTAPQRLSYNVLVIKAKYPVQHLTLPKDKVDLDDESLTRVKAEQEQVKALLERGAEQRLWKRNFVQPVLGPTTGAFGRSRVINGQSRSPHNGEDIAAPLGAEVVAMNDGVVSLTVDHFFSGKGVFLDHGLGLHSMYFHLSEVTVQDGLTVTRGQVIGKVGASGRASGPHLHWGVRLNGARIDPALLIKIPFETRFSAVQ